MRMDAPEQPESKTSSEPSKQRELGAIDTGVRHSSLMKTGKPSNLVKYLT